MAGKIGGESPGWESSEKIVGSRDWYGKNYLEASVIHDDLVKLAEPKLGGAAPMFLMQFHPENFRSLTADSEETYAKDLEYDVLMSEENEEFWKLLKDSAANYRKKQILNRKMTDIAKRNFS